MCLLKDSGIDKIEKKKKQRRGEKRDIGVSYNGGEKYIIRQRLSNQA